MMRVLVVGAGAVGGHFGTLLARAGVDVTFLVRGARAERLRSDGITLVSPEGTRSTTPVSTVTAQDLRDPFDVVLLAVKPTAVAAALEDLAPAVGPETSVVPLLNGIDHLAAIGDRFGARHLLGGVCLVATQLDADGAIRQLTPAGRISLGELSGPVSHRVEAVIAETAAVLEAAGHPAREEALAQVTSTLTAPGSAFATSL